MYDETEQGGSDETAEQPNDGLGLGREFFLGWEEFLWTIRQLREPEEGLSKAVVEYSRQSKPKPKPRRGAGARICDRLGDHVADGMDTVEFEDE